MKTKFSISALLGILVLIILGITSCEKVPMDPVTKYFTIRVINDSNGVVTPDGITLVPEGSRKVLIYTLKPNPGYKGDSVSVNGINLSLTTDTTYNLSNINKDYEIKPIFAKDPKFPWDLVDERGWIETQVFVFIDGTWVNFTTNPVILYFFPNGEKKEYLDGTKIGDAYWDLDQSTTPPTLHTGRCIAVPEGEVTKMELSETTLTLTTVVPTNPVKVIYKHP